MVRLLCAAVALIVLLGLQVAADLAPAPATPGSQSQELRLEQVQQASTQSIDGVLDIRDSNVGRLVHKMPRPYRVVLLLTARHPTHRCTACAGFEKEFRLVAQSYRQLLHSTEGNAPAPGTPPLYFAVADFDDNHKTFKKYYVQTVPYTLYFGEAESAQQEPGAKEKMAGTQSMKNEKLTAEEVAAFVRQHTGIEIPIKRPLWPKLVIVGSIVGVIALSLRMFFDQLWAMAWSLRDSRRLWFAGCLFVFFVAVSGIVYDVIRVPALFHLDQQTGAMAFFSTAANQQYIFEGLIIGGLNVLCALCIVVLATYVPFIKDEGTRTTAMAVCSMGFVFTYLQIVWLYQYKAPWYSILKLWKY